MLLNRVFCLYSVNIESIFDAYIDRYRLRVLSLKIKKKLYLTAFKFIMSSKKKRTRNIVFFSIFNKDTYYVFVLLILLGREGEVYA